MENKDRQSTLIAEWSTLNKAYWLMADRIAQKGAGMADVQSERLMQCKNALFAMCADIHKELNQMTANRKGCA